MTRNDFDRYTLGKSCRGCEHYWERKSACCYEGGARVMTLQVTRTPGSTSFEFETTSERFVCSARQESSGFSLYAEFAEFSLKRFDPEFWRSIEARYR